MEVKLYIEVSSDDDMETEPKVAPQMVNSSLLPKASIKRREFVNAVRMINIK